MDATAMAPTMGAAFPWLKMTFDYTDDLAKLIPDGLLEWRHDDPTGKWCFSLGEIAMHCADARIMFARQLSGNDSVEGYCSEGPGDEGVWTFKACDGKQGIMDCLAVSRKELEPYLQMPVSAMGDITAGSQAAYDKQLAAMKEKGQDTTEAEARGPASVVRVLMAIAVHEAGHRGSLQTLLRQKGINFGE